MAITTRQEFKQYCLRRLGFPVISINVDDDQIEDRIDDSIQMFADYHMDGTEKMYYKHQITANNFPKSIYDLTLVSGGSNYSNSDLVVFSGNGIEANASITTDANGTITAVNLANNGTGYSVAPTVTIASANGSGASITSRLGGFITVPENIIGVVRMFDLSSSISTHNIFSIQYQIALNDLYNLSSASMVPYYMVLSHLELIQQLLVGQQPIRYNRHRNQVFIDMLWDRVTIGEFIIIEAYQVVDPNEFPDVWDDRWLKRYATALIKRQYGEHLKKFNLQLPGNVTYNGQQIYNEAVNEINMLESELIHSYSIPVSNFIG